MKVGMLVEAGGLLPRTAGSIPAGPNVRSRELRDEDEDPARWSRPNGEPSNRRSQMLYVRAKMTDGTEVVSSFERLQGIRKLSADVLGNRKAFPVWRVVDTTHPVSGEPCLTRTRQFVSGRMIAHMEVVTPTTEDHEYNPDNFEPVVEVQRGDAGRMLFTEDMDAVEGITVGVEYPLHRAPDGRRFVIVTSNSGEGEEDVLHYIDDEAVDMTEALRDVMEPGAPVVDASEDYDDEDAL